MERRKNIDGGFAWLILCASFTVMFFTGMLSYSTGVINTAILEEVDNDISRTSWIGSTMLATFTLCGPLAGLLTKVFGYRVSCFCGGILTLTGLAAASFVNDVTGLILTYGIIAGFGMGMALNSSQVVPGYYFHRRRGLAFGVTASGAGMGMFAGGPLARVLIEKYRLRGCLLIFGSICSNMCVAASLLRPVSGMKAQRQQTDVICVPLHASNAEMVKKQKDCILADAKLSNPFNVDIEHTESKLDATAKNQNDTEHHALVETQPAIKGAQTTQTHSENVSLLGTVEPDLDHEAVFSDNEQDLPLEHIHKGRSHAKEKLHLDELGYSRSRLLDRFRAFVTSSIINKYGFLCYCLSVMFWAMGEGACLFHLPNYAETKGSTKSESASLFTVMGLTSLVSRLLAGFAGNDPNIGFLILHIGLMGMIGMLTLLSPLLSRTYTLQMAFSAAYGLYSGGGNSLMGPMTIELVGLKNLPVGLGVLNFFCGIGFLIGPPMASGILLMAAFFGCMIGLFAGRSQPPPRVDRPREINVEVESDP